jgi:hypothetical protein
VSPVIDALAVPWLAWLVECLSVEMAAGAAFVLPLTALGLAP